MKRLLVDFNTLMQDVEHGNQVILGVVNEDELASLRVGERVIAFDDELEVEGVVEHEGVSWFAALDFSTLKRFASTQ